MFNFRSLRLPLLPLSLSLMFVLMHGCSLYAPVNMAEVKTFTLDTAPDDRPLKKWPKTKTERPARGILLVKKPSAKPGYTEASMLYSAQQNQLSRFTQNKWVAPPADMLWPLLINGLQETGHYKAVLKEHQATVNPDRVLCLDALSLKQIFAQNQASSIELTFNFTLTQPESNKVLVQKTIHVSIPTASPDPYAGVMAASQAVQLALKQLISAIQV